jgi:hypothetical protein
METLADLEVRVRILIRVAVALAHTMAALAFVTTRTIHALAVEAYQALPATHLARILQLQTLHTATLYGYLSQ